MAETMIASGMTDGQIDEFANKLRAALRKHRSMISLEVAQRISGIENIGMELFAPIRAHAERISKMIVRPFKVDRTKTPAELLADCKRVPWYIDEAVLATMPMDGPAEGNLVFLPLEKNTPVANIPKVLEGWGLAPDYAAQMQVNADYPSFADEHPNGMQWAENSYAYFDRLGDEREVNVYRSDNDWDGDIWFAGRRK